MIFQIWLYIFRNLRNARFLMFFVLLHMLGLFYMF